MNQKQADRWAIYWQIIIGGLLGAVAGGLIVMSRDIVYPEHVATIVIGCMVAGALVFVPRRRWGLFSYPQSRPLISTSIISPILLRYPVFSRFLAFAFIAIEVGVAVFVLAQYFMRML